MKKVVRLTESELVRIIENLTLGHELEEKKEGSSTKTQSVTISPKTVLIPWLKIFLKKLIGHLECN